MSAIAMATAAAVAAAASEAVSGYAAYQQGKAEKKANDTNAEILRRNAMQKRLETSINEDTLRQQNRRKLSAARAAAAESGLSDSETMTEALAQEAAVNEQNALDLRWQGESEASNFLNQANLQNYYGKMAKANGKNAFRMGLVNGGLNGIATFGSLYKPTNTKK